MPHRSTPHRRQPDAAPRHPNRINEEREGPYGGVLRLQRIVGNQATRQLLEVQRCGGEVHAGCPCAEGSSAKDEDAGAPQIQRAPEAPTAGAERGAGGRPPLASPRFAGDALLEACHQDKARLGVGARGESVRKVQQALIDLGSGLGAAGADGVYGQATAAAVRQFKAKEKLGFEQFGDVGPGTMQRLDELFPATPPGPTPADEANKANTSGGEEEDPLSCPAPQDVDDALDADPELAASVVRSVAGPAADPGVVGAPGVGAPPHVDMATVVEQFKKKVDNKLPGGARNDRLNVSNRGQFFVEASLRAEIVTETERIRASGQLEAMAFADRAIAFINAVNAGDKGAKAILADLDTRAATTISTEKAAMQAVLAPTKSAGGAIDAELFAAFDGSKDDAIPQRLLLKFRSLRAWRSVRSFDESACGGHALRIARRIRQKGGLVPRKAKGAAVAAVLATGTGTNDMRPVGDKDHFLGDVIAQTGVGAAVAQMRRALDDGRTVHARVLSGIGYGIGKTATGATTSSDTAKPIPIGKPPEEHSLLIIGYDGDKFVFNDADPKSSHIFEAGFGLLTFDSASGRLSTAESGTDMVVSTAGLHANGDRRYQIISLTSV
jgi:peptidoglycan hydrolase-like protein with peptidoglycan-binding domain